MSEEDIKREQDINIAIATMVDKRSKTIKFRNPEPVGYKCTLHRATVKTISEGAPGSGLQVRKKVLLNEPVTIEFPPGETVAVPADLACGIHQVIGGRVVGGECPRLVRVDPPQDYEPMDWIGFDELSPRELSRLPPDQAAAYLKRYPTSQAASGSRQPKRSGPRLRAPK